MVLLLAGGVVRGPALSFLAHPIPDLRLRDGRRRKPRQDEDGPEDTDSRLGVPSHEGLPSIGTPPARPHAPPRAVFAIPDRYFAAVASWRSLKSAANSSSTPAAIAAGTSHTRIQSCDAGATR